MLIEALALATHRRLNGRGLKTLDIVLLLLPGLCLLLALRASLAGQAWIAIALRLGAALISHLADLWRRLCVSC
jgi:hypothetical protein